MKRSKSAYAPGDIVLGLATPSRLMLRFGTVIAVVEPMSYDHYGCNKSLIVLWSDKNPIIVNECECSVVTPDELFSIADDRMKMSQNHSP